MKKYIYSFLLAFVAFSMVSCDDFETYAEQRDKELSAIANYIVREKIKVISEEEFLANDTMTDVSKNEYVLFENTGVYMQVVSRGCGSILKNSESATVLCRFTEFNINGDSIQRSNDVLVNHYIVDKFDVRNESGTFYASFDTSSSLMYRAYGSAQVPNGWLMPLSYIKLGRPNGVDEEIAHVKIIVPHDQGQSSANSSVYACCYDITYQRGI